jgi:nicotinate-nucleotide adenylyltransferase
VKPPRSLGLLGGSFNPVHSGHVLLARHAREALKLDEVWLIPCAASADGKALAPGALRLRWIRKALRGEEGLKASAVELKRGGVSRTIDTLRELRSKLGPAVKFTVLLGQDQALRLPGWKDAREIPDLARLAVFRRPGLKEQMPKAFHALFVSAPLFEISSSEIRSRIRNGKSVSLLVPPALVRDPELARVFRSRAKRRP